MTASAMTQKEWEQSVQWVGIVTGCVIKKDGKYLLIQEKQERAYGLWNLPLGYVDKGEEIEAAAVRETKEESGYEVELDGKIGIYHENISRPVKHIFKARILGGELKIPEDEILNAKWLTYAEVERLHNEDKLRAQCIFDAITQLEKSSD